MYMWIIYLIPMQIQNTTWPSHSIYLSFNKKNHKIYTKTVIQEFFSIQSLTMQSSDSIERQKKSNKIYILTKSDHLIRHPNIVIYSLIRHHVWRRCGRRGRCRGVRDARRWCTMIKDNTFWHTELFHFFFLLLDQLCQNVWTIDHHNDLGISRVILKVYFMYKDGNGDHRLKFILFCTWQQVCVILHILMFRDMF